MADPSGTQSLVSTIASVLAIAISSLTLGWTIYRDAIRKPKFRVNITAKKIIRAGHPTEEPYLFVEALNLGPIPNRVGLTFLRKNWIRRKILDREHGGAMVYPDFKHWATTQASTRLEVGDQANFVFTYDPTCFLAHSFMQVGVADGFGSVHWCSRREFRKAQRKYQKDFSSS